MATTPKQKKAIQAWHAAERAIINEFREEYETLLASFRKDFDGSRAKNKARQAIVKAHYNEFKTIYEKERISRSLDRNENKFVARVISLKDKHAPNAVIEREIRTFVQARTHATLRQLFKEEYLELKTKQLSYFSDRHARRYADIQLRENHKDAYTKIFFSVKEQIELEIKGLENER